MCFTYLVHFHQCQRITTLGHVIRESVVKPRCHWEYRLLSCCLIDTCIDDLIVYTTISMGYVISFPQGESTLTIEQKGNKVFFPQFTCY